MKALNGLKINMGLPLYEKIVKRRLLFCCF